MFALGLKQDQTSKTKIDILDLFLPENHHLIFFTNLRCRNFCQHLQSKAGLEIEPGFGK